MATKGPRKYPRGYIKNTPKTCLRCNAEFSVETAIQFDNQKYCSQDCMAASQTKHARTARKCDVCDIDYIGKPGSRFCSRVCQHREYAHKRFQTLDELNIHVTKLLKMSGYDRTELSLDFIVSLFDKQAGKCALTGLEMTWKSGQGRVQTNLSIDRISPLCGYTPENVQLVCRMANMMKGELSQSDFVAVCKQMVKKAEMSACPVE